MGYSAYSYAVFGLKVSKDIIFVEEKVRSCNHHTDVDAKFCSECGRPIYQTETNQLVDYGYDNNKIGYFVSSHDNDDYGILGFALAKTDYNSNTSYLPIPSPSQDMIEQLKAFLQEHHIDFKEENLRSYLYTYHSY